MHVGAISVTTADVITSKALKCHEKTGQSAFLDSIQCALLPFCRDEGAGLYIAPHLESKTSPCTYGYLSVSGSIQEMHFGASGLVFRLGTKNAMSSISSIRSPRSRTLF